MPNCSLKQDDMGEATLNFVVTGRQCHIVTHVRLGPTQPATVAIAESLFTGIKSNFNAGGLTPLLAPTTSFAGVSLRDMRTTNNAKVDSTGAALVGTAATDALPRQIAACLTVRTAKAGKSYRGRMYVPGFAEIASDASGLMTAPTKTALDAIAAALVNTYAVSGIPLVVWHRPVMDLSDCSVVKPGSIENATQIVCRDTRWDTQRRRNK